jgi:hypothetical protein
VAHSHIVTGLVDYRPNTYIPCPSCPPWPVPLDSDSRPEGGQSRGSSPSCSLLLMASDVHWAVVIARPWLVALQSRARHIRNMASAVRAVSRPCAPVRSGLRAAGVEAAGSVAGSRLAGAVGDGLGGGTLSTTSHDLAMTQWAAGMPCLTTHPYECPACSVVVKLRLCHENCHCRAL